MTFREWMTENKLTYMAICRKTGIDYQTVARWGSGNRKPRSLYLKLLMKHYPDCPLGLAQVNEP